MMTDALRHFRIERLRRGNESSASEALLGVFEGETAFAAAGASTY